MFSLLTIKTSIEIDGNEGVTRFEIFAGVYGSRIMPMPTSPIDSTVMLKLDLSLLLFIAVTPQMVPFGNCREKVLLFCVKIVLLDTVR